MYTPIDIKDRQHLKELLQNLSPGKVPLWGSMNAQQMIEHLVRQVRWTNGKWMATCERSAEQAERSKQKMIYTDAEMPQNVFLETLPETFEFTDIVSAVSALMDELDLFDEYFKQEGITSVHGGFGPMNHQEWMVWHGKHFAHHFRQFGLVP